MTPPTHPLPLLPLPSAALPPLQLSLQFADARARELLPRHRVRRWVLAAMRLGPASYAEAGLDGDPAASAQITVRVVDEVEGQKLNAAYRGKDYATNVLTFDYSHWPPQADVVLCAPVVAAEAQSQGKPLQAHYAHLIVHGVLHAAGWDHQTEAEAQAMEAAEIAILAQLGFPNPYADGTPMPGA